MKNMPAGMKENNQNKSSIKKTLYWLLAGGIPAKKQVGVVGSEGFGKGLHAWVEFLVPLKNGEYRWLLSDPTWGDHAKEDDFFMCSQYTKAENEHEPEKLKHFYMLGLRVFIEHAEYSLAQVQDWKIHKKDASENK